MISIVGLIALAGCGGGSGGSGQAAAAFGAGDCVQLAQAMQGIDDADFASTGDFGVVADRFKDVADKAPREIRDDMKVVAGAFAAFADLLDDVGFDPGDPSTLLNLSDADIERIDKASDKIETPEVKAAAARLETFFEANCS